MAILITFRMCTCSISTPSAFRAFTTPSTPNTSNTLRPRTFKDILESPTTTRVFFDIRNDSDALFSHFNIKLRGVEDLQLMENLSRRGNSKKLKELADCIKYDFQLIGVEKRNRERVKQEDRSLFAPGRGGRYELFNERPLRSDIKAYCEQDVRFMPGLHKAYEYRIELGTRGRRNWRRAVAFETDKRLEDSWSDGFEPHGSAKAKAPIWENHNFGSGGDDEMTARDCDGWEEDMIKEGDGLLI